MKAILRYLVLFWVVSLFSGCASRFGASQKSDDYHDTLENVTVTFVERNFDDPAMKKSLKRCRFDRLGEYLSRSVPSTFTSAGIDANYVAYAAEAVEAVSETGQRIVITPRTSVTTVHADRFTSPLGPMAVHHSVDPAKIAFDVAVIDLAMRKRVWSGEFFPVGPAHGQFSEEFASAFLNDVIQKLREDGLVATVATRGIQTTRR